MSPPEGCKQQAVSGLSPRMALISTKKDISVPFSTNGLTDELSCLVRPALEAHYPATPRWHLARALIESSSSGGCGCSHISVWDG